MSFPRAKIQRFNDVKACTPSPADYNVVLKDKKKGSVIGQSDRFTEPRSPTLSDNGSVNSTPCFRTPNKPTILKKKYSASDVKSKTIPNDLYSNQYMSEMLNEKNVECKNKDLYIGDLTEQLECMKNKIAHLEEEKCVTESEKLLFEKQVDLLKSEHNLNFNNLKSLHEIELHKFRTEVLQALEQLATMKEEYNHMNTHYKREMDNMRNIEQNALQNINDILETKNQEIIDKDREISILNESLAEMQENHKVELEQLKEMHKEKIDLVKKIICERLYLRNKHLNELINDKNNLVEEICHCIRKEYNTLNLEFEKKFKDELKKQKSEHEIALIEKVSEVESTLKLKLEEQEQQHEQILKECQAISEYNIIQTELEKNEMKNRLHEKELENSNLSAQYDDICTKYSHLTESYNTLQCETAKIIADMQAKNDTLSESIANKEIKILDLLSEKHTYEITVEKHQDTIHVLTKRLINSGKDVEQLKRELHLCEAKIITYEEKCMLLNSEVQELQTSIDELDMQTESTLKLTELDIIKVKQDLLYKLEDYKQITERLTTDLQDKLLKKEAECEAFMLQLEHHQKVNSDCQILVTNVESHLEYLESENSKLKSESHMLNKVNNDLLAKVSSCEQIALKCKELERQLVTVLDDNKKLSENTQIQNDDISRLRKQLQQMQEKSDIATQYCDYYKCKIEECQNEIEEAAEIRKKYIDQSGKYDDLLQKFEMLQNENNIQRKMIADQDSLIGPFREQLEKYELEKKALKSEKDYIENEAKEIGMKYAEILGHQNHKQKIKHLINLKLKNEELTKDKLELESKLRSQAKQIEKFRKENADLRKSLKKPRAANEDKENFNSPNVSLNSSKLDSPGPLRERN